MAKLIEPYNVYGNGSIRLEIPLSPQTIGMKEFFEELLYNYEKFYGEKPNRFSQRGTMATVNFTLQELAESAFARYLPRNFARELLKKLSKETDQSEALCKRIEKFEDYNKAVYLTYMRMQNGYHTGAWYLAPVSNIGEAELMETYSRMPTRLRSKTKFKNEKTNMPRDENNLIARCPIRSPLRENQARRVRDILRDHGITTYTSFTSYNLGHKIPDLNPLSLIRAFEDIEVSRFKLVFKEK